MSHKMTPERRQELDDHIADRRARVARFTPSPRRAAVRISMRGQYAHPWTTKRHTPHRKDATAPPSERGKLRLNWQARGLQLVEALHRRAA